MSDFNDANEISFRAVYGRHYQGDEPCDRPAGITEKDGVLHGVLRIGDLLVGVKDEEIDLTGKPMSHKTWAELAMQIECILAGY
jgi:hypothetical protein